MAQTVKHLSTMQETRVQSLGCEDPLEKEMAIHSSTIAWKIPWTEEPGRLQSMGSHLSLPIHPTLPPPARTPALGVHTFVLYICVSISTLQIGSPVPFF